METCIAFLKFQALLVPPQAQILLYCQYEMCKFVKLSDRTPKRNPDPSSHGRKPATALIYLDACHGS